MSRAKQPSCPHCNKALHKTPFVGDDVSNDATYSWCRNQNCIAFGLDQSYKKDEKVSLSDKHKPRLPKNSNRLSRRPFAKENALSPIVQKINNSVLLLLDTLPDKESKMCFAVSLLLALDCKDEAKHLIKRFELGKYGLF